MSETSRFLIIGGPADGTVQTIDANESRWLSYEREPERWNLTWPPNPSAEMRSIRPVLYLRRSVRVDGEHFHVFAEQSLSVKDVIRRLIDHYRPPR